MYKKGETARGKHFTLVFVRGKDAPRIGVSVGNKVGHAVVRNKLKRRIRAVIGSKIPRNNALPGYWGGKKRRRGSYVCRSGKRDMFAYRKEQFGDR